MSKKEMRFMNWRVAEAKQRFSEVLRAAQDEPQPVYKRNDLVAAVVSGETFEEFQEWRKRRLSRTLAEATEELRRLVAEEGDLEIPDRRDRPNAFLDALRDETPL